MSAKGFAVSAVAVLGGAALWLWLPTAFWTPGVSSPKTVGEKGPGSLAVTSSDVLKKAPGPDKPQGDLFAGPTVQAQCEAVLLLTNPVERKRAFEKMLAGLKTTEELQGVLAAFEGLLKSGRRHGAEWSLFWETLGHRDPRQAVELIQKNGPEKFWYFDAVNRVAEQWGALDPEAAMKWLNDNEALTGKQLDAALASAVQGYANRDVKAATAYALSVVKPEEPLFRTLVGKLTRAARQQGGTVGVIEWFNALTSDEQRRGAFEAVASRLAETDPNQQRDWLRSQADKGYRDPDAYRAYAQALAEQNPRAAMDYVFGEAPRFDNGRYAGLGYASYEWLIQDAEGFARYFQTIPSGAQKQAVLDALRDPLSDVNFPMRRRRAGEKFLQDHAQP